MFNLRKAVKTGGLGLVSLLGASWFTMGAASSSVSDDKQLLLYSHHHSYYARKVLLTLEEKKVPYNVRRLEITKGEQYEPWFMKINPRGEIPVLQDGSSIIIDSKRIIDYLNDDFSVGTYISLTPPDVDPQVREKIFELRAAIDAMEGNMLLFGLLYHPDDYLNQADRHYPYNMPGVAGAMKSSVEDAPKMLRSLVEKYPEYKDILLEKAARSERTKQIVQNKVEFDKELVALDSLFASLEQELSTTGKDWLTSDRFTQADVSLAILMDRLWRVGAADHFWGRYPLLKGYFERLQKREAYMAIDTTFRDDLYMFAPYIAIAGAVLLVIIGALSSIPFIVKKYRSSR